MSNSNLSKLAKSIVRDLQKTANAGVKSTRRDLEKQIGQILLINKTRFSKNLIELIPSLGGPAGKPVREKIWKEYTTRLKGLERHIPAERLRELKGTSVIGIRPNDHKFYIRTYGSAVRAKGQLLKAIIKRVFKQEKKKLTKKEEGNLELIGGKTNKMGQHLGHAEHINGRTVGLAASTVRASAIKEKIQRLSTGKDKAKLMKGISQYETHLGIKIDHTQVVDAKGLKKEYVPIISIQDAASNIDLAGYEAAAIRNLENYFKDIANAKASPSIKEALEQVMLHELSQGGKGLKKKVTGKRKKKVSSKSRGSAKAKVKNTKKVNVIADSTMPKGMKSKQVEKGPASEVLALIGVLNSKLPGQVAENMEPPALQYRTGRFASSVRVTEVASTPRGYPSIGYTYQRNPYETFEPGNLQGSVERDPRRLIDRSIREIAAQFAIGRFYTRRT
jgi:hypothetical protein